MSRSKSGLTLLEVVIILVILGVLAALLLPQIVRATRPHENYGWRMCESNLRLLWNAQLNYSIQYGGPGGDMPIETGSAFWIKLQQTPKPLLDRYEPFFCPLAAESFEKGKTSYRGPARSVSLLKNGDAIGADQERNHGEGEGGVVLFKVGDVRTYSENDVEWIQARATTKE